MESELRRLERRVEELESRLAEVEGRLGVPKPEPVPVVEPTRVEAPLPPPAMPAPAMPPPIPPEALVPPLVPPEQVAARSETETETKAGLVWLNRIGAVTLILAVAFGFKAAVDNDLIGPMGRVICGILAGALTLLAGDRLWHRGHRAYSQGIVSLGICIFYLTFYAAFQLYSLVPQTVAFAGALATTLAAGALALRYDARVIAILALLGGYASPFLVSTGQPNDTFFGGYLLVLNAVALTLARRKQWLSVEAVAAFCTVALHTVWIAARGSHIGALLGGVCVIGQFAIFVHSPHAVIRYLAPAPGMIALGALCAGGSRPQFWPLAAAVLGPSLALAYRFGDHSMIAASLTAWIAGLLVYDPSADAPTFVAATLVFLAHLTVSVFTRAERTGVVRYSSLLVNGLFYFWFCFAWFDRDHHGWMGLLAVAVAACYLAAALRLKQTDPQAVLVCAGAALCFLTLAIPIQLSGFSITLAWAIECAALAYLGSRFASRWAFYASWLVGLLAISMALGPDANQAWGKDYSPIVNARFIPFVVLAICLALNAYWSRRSPTAVVPFLAAHLILLIGLLGEAFAWIGHGHKPADDLTSQEAVAGTIVMALYGFALVAHGIAKEFRPHRLLGLGLFALVIGKLYLFDIWQLNWLYRVLAFGGLGALLLSGSFLYSRYRNHLLDLLKDKSPTPDA